MNKILISNARLVNEGECREVDVLIAGQRIERIAAAIPADKDTRVIDARGRHLLPGMIDDQVHFREPGLSYKADIASESTAAVAGGVTSFMEMPNVMPPTTDRSALTDKYARAAGSSIANYSFYLGATNDNIEVIRALEPGEACGVKVFMGASTGKMLVDDPSALDRIFAETPLLVATHCEDTPMIEAQEERFRARYGEDVPMSAHPEIRSAEACYASSSLAVDLARRHGTRLHVLHLSTARELELFEPGPCAGKRITAEVCVHHLTFDDSEYETLGAQIKCNPAIKTRADREALINALGDGRIDVVATDHAPHTWDEKQRPYFQAPSGLPLIQHVLIALLELYHNGHLSLEAVAEKTSHSVAQCFGIRERGFVREGYWADLVLVDVNAVRTVNAGDLLYKCAWSPFEGRRFRSSIAATIVSGQLAYLDGQVQGGVSGERIEFDQAW